MKETRKQKEDRQRGHAADRAFDPIRAAIDTGDLVISTVDPLRYYDHDGDGYWRQCRYCGAFAQLKYNGKVTGDVLTHIVRCPVRELEALMTTGVRL